MNERCAGCGTGGVNGWGQIEKMKNSRARTVECSPGLAGRRVVRMKCPPGPEPDVECFIFFDLTPPVPARYTVGVRFPCPATAPTAGKGTKRSHFGRHRRARGWYKVIGVIHCSRMGYVTKPTTEALSPITIAPSRESARTCSCACSPITSSGTCARRSLRFCSTTSSPRWRRLSANPPSHPPGAHPARRPRLRAVTRPMASPFTVSRPCSPTSPRSPAIASATARAPRIPSNCSPRPLPRSAAHSNCSASRSPCSQNARPSQFITRTAQDTCRQALVELWFKGNSSPDENLRRRRQLPWRTRRGSEPKLSTSRGNPDGGRYDSGGSR